MGHKKTGGRESLFWADQIAKSVKERVEADPVLQGVVRKNGYIVYDEKTPSGKIHVGSGRGWIIHDMIAKAMRELGLKARFILSSDDMDPYDKPNRDLPKSFDKYLGMPFRDIPSPAKGFGSFADYYFRQCTDRFDEFGIEAELESTGDRYIRGDFNKAIKIILDNQHMVQDIYKSFYGKPLGRLPFNPICQKCGRIGTTYAYEWDGAREVIKYRCEPGMVSWAKGCGHEGEVSPYDGGGKLPWKVEWPAKWLSVGVVCELAGKDHFTKGGSRSIGIAISREVLGFPPPFPSTGKSTGKGYEFFTVGGKKMSTSKGMGIGFAEMTGYLPAKMVRYLLARTRPHARVDFDPLDDNDMILLYDRFDRTQRIYHGKERVGERERDQERRIYEFSSVGEIERSMPPQIPLTYAATIEQISPDIVAAIRILQGTGHLPARLSKSDKAHLRDRLGFARRWVESLASERYRFRLQDKASVEVKGDVRQVILALSARLRESDYDEKGLLNLFHGLCKERGVGTKVFFRTMYRILIGKDYGPRLAPFILSIGREKVARLLAGV
ncbi:MAG: lysine--tRNA ligase [Candidatus Aenigmarchaeota archaeon]|nr:lysine--tRNA ligase [Candidatus Aenigmarchaeota archaeon]